MKWIYGILVVLFLLAACAPQADVMEKEEAPAAPEPAPAAPPQPSEPAPVETAPEPVEAPAPTAPEFGSNDQVGLWAKYQLTREGVSDGSRISKVLEPVTLGNTTFTALQNERYDNNEELVETYLHLIADETHLDGRRNYKGYQVKLQEDGNIFTCRKISNAFRAIDSPVRINWDFEHMKTIGTQFEAEQMFTAANDVEYQVDFYEVRTEQLWVSTAVPFGKVKSAINKGGDLIEDVFEAHGTGDTSTNIPLEELEEKCLRKVGGEFSSY